MEWKGNSMLLGLTVQTSLIKKVPAGEKIPESAGLTADATVRDLFRCVDAFFFII